MKRFFYLIALVIIASCKKDNTAPAGNGFLSEHIKNTPTIEVFETTGATYDPTGDYGIYWGYCFKPSKNIEISAIGAKIPNKGTFKIIISSSGYVNNDNYMFIDSINVNNVNEFTYKNVSKKLMLSANIKYTIAYFSKYKNNLYCAGISGTGIPPLIVNDIEIIYNYYPYGVYANGIYYPGSTTSSSGDKIMGLLDFKYKLSQ